MRSNKYVIFLIVYTVFASVIDFYTNRFVPKVWSKRTFNEKLQMIFYLVLHNVLYYLIYFTLPFVMYNYKTVKMTYLLSYLALLIAVPLHWRTNDDKCWFTVQQNKLLEIDERYGFRDPYLILTNQQACTGNGAIRDKLYYYYLIGAFGITSLMIVARFTKIL